MLPDLAQYLRSMIRRCVESLKTSLRVPRNSSWVTSTTKVAFDHCVPHQPEMQVFYTARPRHFRSRFMATLSAESRLEVISPFALSVTKANRDRKRTSNGRAYGPTYKERAKQTRTNVDHRTPRTLSRIVVTEGHDQMQTLVHQANPLAHAG